MFGLSQKEKDEALVDAVYSEDIEQIAKALGKGGNPNIRSRHGNSLIADAADYSDEQKSLAAVTLFLSAKASPDLTGITKRTALHWAARRGHLSVVKKLADAGADLKAEDNSNDTPLVLALCAGRESVAQFLMDNGGLSASTTNFKFLPMYAVLGSMPDKIILDLIKAGGDINAPDKKGRNALMISVGGKDARNSGELLRIFELLISHPGINLDQVNATGETALHIAIHQGQIVKMYKLVDAGAAVDIDRGKGSALVYAVRIKSESLVRKMIAALEKKNGAGGAADECTKGLFEAAEIGDLKMIKLLIEGGAAIDAVNGAGITAVRIAASRSHRSVVEYLQREGADMTGTGVAPQSSSQASGFAAVSQLTPAPAQTAARFRKIDDYTVEAGHSGPLSLIFNFWTQQMIVRDNEKPAPLTVQNFSDVQRQDAIYEARDALKKLGGKPPEYGVEKRNPSDMVL